MFSFKQYYLTELFQSMPDINTTSNWEILDIDDYDPEGTEREREKLMH